MSLLCCYFKALTGCFPAQWPSDTSTSPALLDKSQAPPPLLSKDSQQYLMESKYIDIYALLLYLQFVWQIPIYLTRSVWPSFVM